MWCGTRGGVVDMLHIVTSYDRQAVHSVESLDHYRRVPVDVTATTEYRATETAEQEDNIWGI